MSTKEMSTFFFLLACFGVFVILIALVILVMRMIQGEHTGWRRRVVDLVVPHSLLLAFVAATTAMLGSLYYSEIAGFTPCKLCWYQRYAMYPASLVLGLALATKRRVFAMAGLALASGGILISTYHRAEQEYPSHIGSSCSLDNPCSGRYVNLFDQVTIPTMAWVGFAFVILFTAVHLMASRPGVSAANPNSVTSGDDILISS